MLFRSCEANKQALVVPTTQDDFWRTNQNPFRRANKRRVLRLDCGGNKVELISTYSISKYVVRYMARPTPIVLENLEEPLSVNGVSTRTECTLSSALHRLILERAVEMATKKKRKRTRNPFPHDGEDSMVLLRIPNIFVHGRKLSAAVKWKTECLIAVAMGRFALYTYG